MDKDKITTQSQEKQTFNRLIAGEIDKDGKNWSPMAGKWTK